MKEIREACPWGTLWVADVSEGVAHNYVESHEEGRFVVSDLRRFHLFYDRRKIDTFESYDEAYAGIAIHLKDWKRGYEHPALLGRDGDLGKWEIVDVRPGRTLPPEAITEVEVPNPQTVPPPKLKT